MPLFRSFLILSAVCVCVFASWSFAVEYPTGSPLSDNAPVVASSDQDQGSQIIDEIPMFARHLAGNLSSACRDGNLKAIQTLMLLPIPPPAHSCATYKTLSIATFMVEMSAFNQSLYSMPFQNAVVSGDVEIVEYLLTQVDDKSKFLNIRDCNDYTVLTHLDNEKSSMGSLSPRQKEVLLLLRPGHVVSRWFRNFF